MKIIAVEPLGVHQQTLEKAKQQLAQLACEYIQYPDRKEDPVTLIERLKDAEIAILSNIPLRKEVLEHCPNLKMISVAFTGVDHIDLDYCKERGIVVSNCAGYSTISVAELTIGMMIDLLRKITELHPITLQGGTRSGFLGRELHGKKVGVVGAGAIGANVMKLLLAFGCEVLAYSRTAKPEWEAQGVNFVTLSELLQQSDIVTLHVPLNKETQFLIGEKELAYMQTHALLINTARGNVVDIKALRTALLEKKIAGAAFDVFDIEPPLPSNHPIMGIDNLLVTPHVAYATTEAFEIRMQLVVNNIVAYLNQAPINVCC